MSAISHCPLSAVKVSSESNSETEKSGQLVHSGFIQTRDRGPPCRLCGVGLVEHWEVILSVRDVLLFLCPPSAADPN